MSGIVGSYFNTRGSGVVAKLGTDGQVFTSTGAGLSQGFEAAAGAWEAEILPLRVPDFTSSSLDDLSLGGEVVWGRFSRRTTIEDSAAGKATMSRNIPIALGL